METILIYDIAGEDLLAALPDEARCDTDLARVTLLREAGGDSYRLTIVPRGEALPEEQARQNEVAARVARRIQETEERIRVLEGGDIRLRGTATELRCSIMFDDAALQAGEADAVIDTASIVIGKALNFLLKVTLPPPTAD